MMAWSTRELAELAGSSISAVRYYHRIGLLEQPRRRWNGYKQYGVRDLVRLLQIRRLAQLGIPLASLSRGQASGPAALKELDGRLAADIERQQRAREAIGAILDAHAPADAPAGFESVAARLSEDERSLIHLYSRLYDEKAMEDLREMVEVDAATGALGAELDRLPADAEESACLALAERLVPALVHNLRSYPWLSEPRGRLSTTEQLAQQTFVEAVAELYNPAQLDVLARASILAQQQLGLAGRAARRRVAVADAVGRGGSEGPELSGYEVTHRAGDE